MVIINFLFRYNFELGIYGTQLAAFGGQPTMDSDQIEVYNETTDVWELTGEKLQYSARHFYTVVSIPTVNIQQTTTKSITSAEKTMTPMETTTTWVETTKAPVETTTTWVETTKAPAETSTTPTIQTTMSPEWIHYLNINYTI